jgi:hypothetical protein
MSQETGECPPWDISQKGIESTSPYRSDATIYSKKRIICTTHACPYWYDGVLYRFYLWHPRAQCSTSKWISLSHEALSARTCTSEAWIFSLYSWFYHRIWEDYESKIQRDESCYSHLESVYPNQESHSYRILLPGEGARWDSIENLESILWYLASPSRDIYPYTENYHRESIDHT